MYQKAVNITRIADENEANEREEVQAKRKLGYESCNPQPRKNPNMFNPS